MPWSMPDFFDGSRTQGHKAHVSQFEVSQTAQWAEHLMMNRWHSTMDQSGILADFGFKEVDGPVAAFHIRVIGPRPGRPSEVVAFFVIRRVDPGVRFIGFCPYKDYLSNEQAINEAMSMTAHFAQ